MRCVLGVFVAQRDVAGAASIPKGAVIFAGNHPNGLLDPNVLMASCPRTMHFMAKATLFSNCLTSRILRGLGAIPVYRKKDDAKHPPAAGAAHDNSSAFDAVHEVLRQGKCFAIFPEGVSHSDSELRELKSGVSHIALRFAGEHPEVPLSIVPVGLTYIHGDRFRCRVLVKFGATLPISKSRVDAYARALQSNDHDALRDVVAALTKDIAEAISTYTVHAKDWHTVELIYLSAQVFRPQCAVASPTSAPAAVVDYSLSHNAWLQTASVLSSIFARIETSEEFCALCKLLDEYHDLLHALSVSDDDVRNDHIKGPHNAISLMLLSMLYICGMAICFPFALIGIFLNLPIILSTHYCGTRLARKGGRDVVATFKLMVAFVVLPVVYSTYVGVFAWYLGTANETVKSRTGMGATAWVFVLLVGIPLISYGGLRTWEEGRQLMRFLYRAVIVWNFELHVKGLAEKRHRLHCFVRSLARQAASATERSQLEQVFPEAAMEPLSDTDTQNILRALVELDRAHELKTRSVSTLFVGSQWGNEGEEKPSESRVVQPSASTPLLSSRSGNYTADSPRM